MNGPYNYMGDGDSGAWIDTLAKAQKLGATIVAPGHGPAGDARVLEAQRQYFVALRSEVEKRKRLTPDRAMADVPAIRDTLLKQHATYIDTAPASTGFESQVAQVYKELTGKEFPKRAALDDARRAHERHHGIADRPGVDPIRVVSRYARLSSDPRSSRAAQDSGMPPSPLPRA